MIERFATDRQLEILKAVNSNGGSRKKAAKSLGISASAVSKTISRVNKRAAVQGYAPEHDMNHIVPDGFIVKGVSTYYDMDGYVKGQWVKSAIDTSKLKELLEDFAEDLVENVRGLAPIIKAPEATDKDLMCVYPMGDPHFGLYAWWQDTGDDFDLEIAESLTCKAIDRLVTTAPNAQHAILLNLGDMFHADNQKNITQSGHQLDVDGRWAKVQQVGLRAMIYCIKRLLEKHEKLTVRINKGNHDHHSSYALSLMIDAYFSENDRVTVDLSPAICWYHRFGKVLIGSTHGDTIKGQNLVGIMAADRPTDWGLTTHRYWLVGHVHHQDIKEYPGGIVEYFRTLAARDAWHAGQGYRAGRDMRLIVMHSEHGEIERHRCDIAMLS